MNTLTFPKLSAGLTICAALLLAAGCGMGDQSNMSSSSAQQNSTHSSSMNNDSMNQNSMDKGSMNDGSMNNSQMNMDSMQTNRYGGPVYKGKPALGVTVALVMAGGGPDDFSLVTALNAMLGKNTVNGEVGKLTKQYGKKRVNMWVKVMDFYVADTLKIAKAKGIELPPPADLSGTELAKALIKAGTAEDGTFWAGFFFDHAVSHAIHVQLMNDADAKFGAKWDANAHMVTNQAFYDVAQALGMQQVKLASYH